MVQYLVKCVPWRMPMTPKAFLQPPGSHDPKNGYFALLQPIGDSTILLMYWGETPLSTVHPVSLYNSHFGHF